MSTQTLHRLAAAALMAGGPFLGYAYVSHPSGATPDRFGAGFGAVYWRRAGAGGRP